MEILKQSSRLVHYCATPLLFDPTFRKQIQEEQTSQPLGKVSSVSELYDSSWKRENETTTPVLDMSQNDCIY